MRRALLRLESVFLDASLQRYRDRVLVEVKQAMREALEQIRLEEIARAVETAAALDVEQEEHRRAVAPAMGGGQTEPEAEAGESWLSLYGSVAILAVIALLTGWLALRAWEVTRVHG